MNEWTIQCGECGQKSAGDNFTRDRSGNYLRPGEFRCPKCGAMFRRVIGVSRTVKAHSGDRIIIPGKVTLEYMEAAS